jgi:hypothetical protein
MNFLGLGTVIDAVGGIIDSVHTSDEERARMALEDKKIDASLQMGQIEVNIQEAQHKSIFVSGWRPAVGWCGVAAMAYQFILYPILIWGWALLQANGYVPVTLTAPPMLETDALWVILTGILGIGGMRSFDKTKGVASK